MGGVFSHAGLGVAARGPFDPNDVMPTGTMMFEFTADPRSGAQVLVDYRSTHPLASGLRVTLYPNGGLMLRHWQGAQLRTYEIATNLVTVTQSVTVTYTWDTPMRRGVLAVESAERNLMIFKELSEPLSLSMRDGMKMMSDTRYCTINNNTIFLALAKTVMPIGMLPTMDGDVPVNTPDGFVPVASLQAGQLVKTPTGKTAQVRWCGEVTLPARGRFAPLTMRAPHHGLCQDIKVSRDQRLRIKGPEVEYMFHAEQIRLNAGDLRDDLTVRLAPSELTQTYWQVVLDIDEPLDVAGLALEGLALSALRDEPALKAHSVLADMPVELMPARSAVPIHLLKSFEAHSLQKLRAA